MELIKLLLITSLQLVALGASAAVVKKPPAQVYEDVDETPLVLAASTSGRTVRQPMTNPLIRYQRFNIFATAQLDQQRWRYLQQQQADANNRARIKRRGRASKREIAPIYLLPQPSLNFGLNHADNMKILQESFGGGQPQEQDIEALNALLGKAPGVQLEGLQQLLTKDHTPITENVVDVENPQIRPNIRVEPAPPEHQEAVAQAHVHADAQKKVKQQYQALAEIQQELDAIAQQAQAQEDLRARKTQQETAQSQTQTQAFYGLNYHPQLEVRPHKVEDGKIYEGTKDLQYASKYAFGYRVRDYHSGNNFGHEEISDGKTAKGHYHVLLPDGRLQNVQYWADETGFHAKVTYDKVAQH